jgi:2-dehydro-3-deoxyphosphogalactonate aldolase
MADVSHFADVFSAMPLIAILRGVRPEETEEIVAAIVESGIRIIEIPLNSPEPFVSIETAARKFSPGAIIGAGTVLTVENVRRVADAGGEIIVSPNFDGEVVRSSKALGLISAPGIMTPSEAFAAIAAGADVLKFFPGELLSLPVIRAYAAVLPKGIPVMIVGGVRVDSIKIFANSPVNGFGIGSSLYKAGTSAPEVRESARAFVKVMRSAGFGAAPA